MTIGNICAREVDLAEADESVQVAAQRMHSRRVGTLVVLDDEKKPLGILTDRDLAVRVLGDGKDAFQTTVREVMTPEPRTVHEESSIESALSLMRACAIRRVVVVDGAGRLQGLLSLDDILSLLTEEFKSIGGLLDQESPFSLR